MIRFKEYLSEVKTKPIIMYHGTSSKFLQKILKKGLIPQSKRGGKNIPGFKNGRWDSSDLEHASFNDPSRKSLDGIYFASNIYGARSATNWSIDAFGENRLFVVAQIQPKMAVMDEDSIHRYVSIAIDTFTNSWVDEYTNEIESAEPDRRALTTEFNLPINYMDMVSKKLIPKFVKVFYQQIITSSGIPEQALTLKVVEDIMIAGIERKLSHLENRTVTYAYHRLRWKKSPKSLEDAYEKILGLTRQQSEKNYQKALIPFIKTLRSLVQNDLSSPNPTIRITEPVTYKGSNKILYIGEVIKDEVSSVIVKSHYNTPHKKFVKDFGAMEGSHITYE